MQESHIIKTLKAQKSSASIATCDHEGDDRHCPAIIPEEDEFYIRTGTQMSCANTGAANFLKNSGLSFLGLDYTDIAGDRSTAQSFIKKKSHLKARVKFSLVAWTTVESVSLDEKDDEDYVYMSQHFNEMVQSPPQYFKMGGNPDYFANSITNRLTNYLHWTRYNQDLFRERFIRRLKAYSSLTEANVKAKPPRLPPLHYKNTTVLPPLAPRVHTLYYDDNVTANAGEVAFNCLRNEDHGVKDPEYSRDVARCLTADPATWHRTKATKTPKQIAKENKKQLLRYFEEVYNPTSSHTIHKPWEGSSGTEEERRQYDHPRLIYSTHFAVQSCQEYVSESEFPVPQEGSRKTAHNMITLLKEKITTQQNDLLDLYETYGPGGCRLLGPEGGEYCECNHPAAGGIIELIFPHCCGSGYDVIRNKDSCYAMLSFQLVNTGVIPEHLPMSADQRQLLIKITGDVGN